MYIEEKNGLRILTPNVGYRIVNKEKTQVYDTVVYLSKLDSIDNYITMPNEEAEQLIKDLETKELEDYGNNKKNIGIAIFQKG